MNTKEEIKQFYELDAELRRKYMLVECLMLKDNNAAGVWQSCTNINVLFNKLSSFARCIFTLSDVNSEGQPILSCLDTAKFEFDKRVEDWFKSINFNSQNDDACTAKEPEVFKPPSVAGSASSSRSSALRREAYNEAKLARLELDHTKERQREKIALDQMSRELYLREVERKVALTQLKLAAWDEQLSDSVVARKNSGVDSKVGPAVSHHYRPFSTLNPVADRQVFSTGTQVVAALDKAFNLPPCLPQVDVVSTNVVGLPRVVYRRWNILEEKAHADDARFTRDAEQIVQNEAECGPSQNRFPYSGNDFWLPKCENEEITRIPKSELIKFSGDPLDYFEFVRNFDLHIGNIPIPDAKKLTFLLQYCDAEVRRQLLHFSKDLHRGYTFARD